MKKSEELKLLLEKKEKERSQLRKQMREKYVWDWYSKRHCNIEFDRLTKERGCTLNDIDQLEFEIRKEQNREIEVGDGVTYHLWSDAYACTVIKKTAKTITIQRDKAILNPAFKPEWIVGGFAGHCTNQDEQSYTYERNPEGETYVCHWSEKEGRYRSGSDGSFKISIGRHEYYDYNF